MKIVSTILVTGIFLATYATGIYGMEVKDSQVDVSIAMLKKQARKQETAGELDHAIASYTRLISLSPNYAFAFLWRGELFGKLKDNPAAIADLRRVTELAPDFYDGWVKLAWLLIASEQFAEADVVCRKARELHSLQYDLAFKIGHTYLLRGDLETAHKWYQKTLWLIDDEDILHKGYTESEIPFFFENSLPEAPIKDFDLFLAKGWQVAAVREERAWMTREGAIPSKQHVQAKQALADQYRTEATKLEQAHDFFAAASAFQQAAKAEEGSGRPRFVFLTELLNRAAKMNEKAARFSNAERLYRETLKLERMEWFSKDRPVGTINNLAGMLKTMGRYGEAEQLYREALEIRRKTGPANSRQLAESLNNLAELARTIGRYGEAEQLYREALEIRRKIALPADISGQDSAPLKDLLRFFENRDHQELAGSLNNLAVLLQTTGRYDEAEPLYREALEIGRKALPAGPNIAKGLINLGLLLKTTGRYGEAEPLYREALEIGRKALSTGQPEIVIANLNNLGNLLATTGRYGEAEPLLREGLEVTSKFLPESQLDIATGLNNLAVLFETTGRYRDAEPLYREVLEILRKAMPAGHPTIATGLNNLAVLLERTERYREAESLYREALEIKRKTLPAGHPEIAISLSNLASPLKATGRFDEAEPLYREAVEILRLVLPADHPDIATSINNLAGVVESTDRSSEAERLYREALIIAHGAGNPETLWNVQGNLSSFYTKREQRPLAILFGKQAVNTLQEVRKNLSQSEMVTQQAFFKSKETFYQNLANLLISEDRLPEAQKVLEMLKQAEYLDFIRRDAPQEEIRPHIPLNEIEAAQAQRIADAAASLRAFRGELNKLTQIHPGARTFEEKARIEALTREYQEKGLLFLAVLDAVAQEFKALKVEKAREYAKNLRVDIDYRNLVQGLGPEVALIQYVILEEQCRILTTTAKGITAYQVKIDRKELNRLALAFYRALKDPGQNPQPAAEVMGEVLLMPFLPELTRQNIHTLMFYLDGVLRYLPMAALHNGKHYLVEGYAVSVFTAAVKGRYNAEHTKTRTVGGLGLSKAHPPFGALPEVPKELMGIIRQAGVSGNGVLDGAIYLDEAFTGNTLKRSLRDFPMVHVASHFAFKPGNEKDSYLLLGDGNRLDLGELRQVDYRFGDLDLLVLSACETGLDSAGAKGQEIEGMATMAQKKGARGVLATLWPVADESTALLMREFYKQREEKKLTKGEALRQAQLALLTGEVKESAEADEGDRSGSGNRTKRFRADPEKPFAHPYYWAPFILMGNWK